MNRFTTFGRGGREHGNWHLIGDLIRVAQRLLLSSPFFLLLSLSRLCFADGEEHEKTWVFWSIRASLVSLRVKWKVHV